MEPLAVPKTDSLPFRSLVVSKSVPVSKAMHVVLRSTFSKWTIYPNLALVDLQVGTVAASTAASGDPFSSQKYTHVQDSLCSFCSGDS